MFVGSCHTAQDIWQPFCIENIQLSGHVFLRYSVPTLQTAGINCFKRGKPHEHSVWRSVQSVQSPHPLAGYLCNAGGLKLYHTACLNYQEANKVLEQDLSLLVP